MRMTLDELINAMEPQARKDKALISKCVDGLTEYAAELRQKAGDAGKEQISALRRLVDELAGYWGLDAKTVDHVTAFDRKIQEVDQAVHQWTPTQEHRDAVIQGLSCQSCSRRLMHFSLSALRIPASLILSVMRSSFSSCGSRPMTGGCASKRGE